MNFKRKTEDGLGRTTGDARTTAQGKVKQPDESIQELYDQARDGAGEAIDAVRKSPGSVEDSMREYIFARPFSTAAIALGLGWLLGRSHRPF